MRIFTPTRARQLRFIGSIILIYFIFIRALLAPLPASAALDSKMSALCLTQTGVLQETITLYDANQPDLPRHDIACCDEACLVRCADLAAPLMLDFARAFNLRTNPARPIVKDDNAILSGGIWRLSAAPGAPRAPPLSAI
mgnify:CR=1 FL=1